MGSATSYNATYHREETSYFPARAGDGNDDSKSIKFAVLMPYRGDQGLMSGFRTGGTLD